MISDFLFLIILTIILWIIITNKRENETLIQTEISNGSKINVTGGFKPDDRVMYISGEKR